jgi:hypothetical protein
MKQSLWRTLVSWPSCGYLKTMQAKAIVGGRLVSFQLSPELSRAHRVNAGKTMTDKEAVAFIEKKRRALALRRARPYLESRS